MNFIDQLRLKLINDGICQADVDFILTFISPSPMDENLWRMNNDAYRILSERGLWEPLQKATRDLGGGNWIHCNEPLI